MKGKIHVPVEQYGFIEVELEGLAQASPGEAALLYDNVKRAFAPKPINEMPAKEFDKFVENMLMAQPNHTETIDKLSPAQRTTFNVIKRALNRIQAKTKKETTYWGAMPPHLLDGGQSD